jgi:hypothetical protein
MTAPRDPDSILSAWLDEGPTRLPESTRRAILVSTRTSHQKRHRMWVPWRTSMNPIARFAVAAIAVVAVVGIVGLNLRGPGPGTGTGVGSVRSPTPTPTATPPASAQPSPRPSPTPIGTATWTTYISARYGFSIGHPADWSVTPADHDWIFAKDAGDTSSPEAFTAWEHFLAPDGSIAISAWSVAVTPGTTVTSWIRAYCPIAESGDPCATIQSQAVAVTVDGHSGTLIPFAQDTQAFFIVNNRMYVVASWRPAGEYDSLRLLEAYLSTMHLLPGGPAPSAATPRPS